MEYRIDGVFIKIFYNDVGVGLMENKVLVTGYSKIPGGIAGSDVYSVIGLSLLVDATTGKILEADTNLVISLARRHINDILVGEKITDLQALEYRFKSEYHGSARKALIVAMKICYDRYLKAIENRKNLEEKN